MILVIYQQAKQVGFKKMKVVLLTGLPRKVEEVAIITIGKHI